VTDWVGKQMGNYRLSRLLGHGGFADVYLADHLYLHTKAAIKVLHTELSSEELVAFQNEARTIASLIHPHIIRVLDFGVEQSIPYLVMDYAPHGTVRQALPQNVPLSPQHILPVVQQVASALLHAHERKIVHRDVKPENMLLGLNGEVVLSDFGIATVSHSFRLSSDGLVVGTASYMAPEQIQGRAVTASDQYALGVVVYEWLSGERPFQGTFTEVTGQHIHVPPPPLRSKVPSLSPSIEEVVLIALSKEPQKRFATVAAFVAAFEEAVQGERSFIRQANADELALQNAPTILSHPPTIVSPDVVTPPAIQNPPPLPPTVSVQTSFPPHSIPPLPSEPEKGRISRRTFFAALLGSSAAVAVATGAVIWWDTSQRGYPSSLSGNRAAVVRTPATAETPRANSQPTSSPSQSPLAETTPDPAPSTGLALGSTIEIYRGHQGEVYADTWSPDGKRVATGGQDTTVQVWDALTGGNVVVYRGHSQTVWAVDWQPNGSLIASGSGDTTVQVWNAQSALPILSYTGHSRDVYTVAWSPDGTRIASGGVDKTVQIWDATTGAPVQMYTGHNNTVRVVSWDPTGETIASCGDDGTVQVWDVATGSPRYVYTLPPNDSPDPYARDILAVAWSNHGDRIVVGGGDAIAYVLDAANGSPLLTYRGHLWRIWSVAWSPDDAKVVSSSHDGTAQIWDAETAAHIYTYTGHGFDNTVWQALWSPNGQLIASAGLDGTARVWQAM
jgi:serine/threonine protein kinase